MLQGTSWQLLPASDQLAPYLSVCCNVLHLTRPTMMPLAPPTASSGPTLMPSTCAHTSAAATYANQLLTLQAKGARDDVYLCGASRPCSEQPVTSRADDWRQRLFEGLCCFAAQDRGGSCSRAELLCSFCALHAGRRAWAESSTRMHLSHHAHLTTALMKVSIVTQQLIKT
jgi:hypothetical protein